MHDTGNHAYCYLSYGHILTLHMLTVNLLLPPNVSSFLWMARYDHEKQANNEYADRFLFMKVDLASLAVFEA